MTRYPARSVRRADFRRRAAFTIIELLTVMAIILLLAGLVLGLAGSAQNKAAQARAKSEIEAFSTAANNYQVDNGTYPRVTLASGGATSNTDGLDAQKSYDPAASVTPTYSATSLILYQLLSGFFYVDPATGKPQLWSGTGTVAKPTVYFPFKDSQLKTPGNITSGYIDPSTVTAIQDPFGLSYGYSTAYQKDMDDNNTNGTNIPPTHGYNPTFDLWSTAGYSPNSGKAYPADANMDSTKYNTLWIKNW